MTFTKEQKKLSYQRLSPEMQFFTTDQEISEIINNILQNEGLNEEQIDLADSEILYTMYGLQSLRDAIINIGKISGRSVENLTHLRNNLENQVFSKMPDKKMDLLVDNDKISEVSEKYSLSEQQSNILPSLVNADIESVSQKLGVSKLIAEQITLEMKKRFSPMTTQENVIKTSTLPEIKPDNLPAVEIGQESKPYSPVKSSEVVQKPYSVPRFGMKTLEPKVPVINLAQNMQNMMDNKLNSITTNIPPNIPLDMQKKDTPASSQTTAPKLPPTKYDADPYREPLQ